MSLNDLEQLDSDLKEAAKTRDQIRLTVLRLLKSALKNYEIEVGHDASPQEIMTILQKEAKKRRDSIEQYEKAGRSDLVEEESKELEIIQTYLPKEMSDDQLDSLVREAIAQTGASGLSDMGKVIPVVIKSSKGSASNDRISAKVKQVLEN
ncbi:MAG TPA: GatB/YqeY domain-containing protein [Candidatus Saccharibacteria bacterium]|nr:GatB/YqeY domain-containing protein [Candidatus Saccharibacteria bacterium]